MADTIKITKAMVLAEIKAQVGAMTFNGDVTAEDVIAYCDTTIAQMEKKAEKAKERAAEKREAEDELLEVVKAVLTAEPQTRAQVFAQIDDPSGELTLAKVGARLTKLCNSGDATKCDVKVDGKAAKAYSLA